MAVYYILLYVYLLCTPNYKFIYIDINIYCTHTHFFSKRKKIYCNAVRIVVNKLIIQVGKVLMSTLYCNLFVSLVVEKCCCSLSFAKLKLKYT